MGIRTTPSFRLKNIIGIEALDMEVHPKLSLSFCSAFDVLVFDPGEMVGWAGTTSYGGTRPTCIEVGQDRWHECLRFRAERIFIETTPFAARRTFDPWPIRFDGAVRAKIHPVQPEPVQPTSLKVARQWFKLPRGHGLGRHAKDALTHLVHVLATQRAS